MSEWIETTLAEIADIKNGGTPSTKIDAYWDGDIAWITPKDLSTHSSKFIAQGERCITKLGLKKSSANILPNNTVLFSSRAPIGYVAIANNQLATNQGFKNIVCNPNKSDFHFIYYWLKSSKNRIESLSSGSTFSEASASLMKSLEIYLPSLEEQKAIASILSNLDSKIDLLRRQNQTLENIAQILFKRWFVDFEFPDEIGKPYKSSGGKMVESELGEIPEGWMAEDFEKTIEFIVDNRGKTPPISITGHKLLEGFNIVNGQCFPDFDNEEKQKYVSAETFDNWFRDGHPKHLDILCATVGTLPKWCFTPKKTNFCIAQNIVAFRIDNKISSPYYIKLLFDSHYFRHEFNGRLITAVQPSIKIGHMTSITIVIPVINIIKKYDKIVSAIFEKIENNFSEIQTLTKTRDTLLPKLMSGQIRVKNL